jgi:tight adherence protein B
LIFLAVTLGAGACFLVLADLMFGKSELVRQRLDNEFRRNTEEGARSPLFRNLDSVNLDQPPSVDLGGAPAPLPTRIDHSLRGRLESMIEQADLKITLRQLLLVAAGLGMTVGAAASVWLGAFLGLAGAAIGAATPLVYVRMRRDQRRDRFLSQLPAAFDLMARVLRSGSSVPQALQAVADAFEPPISQEFAVCQKQQNLGLRPDVTFHEMAERSGILEMRIFVMALLIQRQSGGNLSEMLERLSALIRARLKLARQIRVLTAEGRLQGWTLFVLPFLMFGAMMVINRPYAEILLEHVSLIGATLAAMLVGAFWIHRIVRMEV